MPTSPPSRPPADTLTPCRSDDTLVASPRRMLSSSRIHRMSEHLPGLGGPAEERTPARASARPELSWVEGIEREVSRFDRLGSRAVFGRPRRATVCELDGGSEREIQRRDKRGRQQGEPHVPLPSSDSER